MDAIEDLPHLPGGSGLLKAALVVVVALGAAEQLRHGLRRLRRAAREWWIEEGHRERDRMLRRTLGAVAAELIPVVVETRRGSVRGPVAGSRRRSPRS